MGIDSLLNDFQARAATIGLALRQSAALSPAHCRTPGSKRHREGMAAKMPSCAPSDASHCCAVAPYSRDLSLLDIARLRIGFHAASVGAVDRCALTLQTVATDAARAARMGCAAAAMPSKEVG